MATADDHDTAQGLDVGFNKTDMVDSAYFASYEDLSVHALMLKDRPRTLAYKNFIEGSAHLIKDKVVIDVGAGTGILSLFAARAGAKKVYAIESSKLSCTCALLVQHNGYDDVIDVIHNRVEEAKLPDGLQADVIISEWMGFYLLHESMLDAVIVARDRWLSPDGHIIPCRADLFLCPVEMKEYCSEQFGFWSDVYGFDFSPIVPVVRQGALAQPAVTSVTPAQCLSPPELVASLDLNYISHDDIRVVRSTPSFVLSRHGVLHGFACWFDVTFGDEEEVDEGEISAPTPPPDTAGMNRLSTGPGAEPTHWQQTVILLPDALLVSRGDSVACQLELIKDSEQHRRYNITLEVDEDQEEEVQQEEGKEVVIEGDGGQDVLVSDGGDGLIGRSEFEGDIRSQIIQAMDANRRGASGAS